MTNLTITVDEEILRTARIRALEQGSSVNALLREYLESFAGRNAVYERAIQGLDAIAESTQSGSGGRRWTREDLYDRAALRKASDEP